MVVLAKSNGKVPVIRGIDKKEFEERFNSGIPSKEFMETCEKAWELVEQTKEKMQLHNGI